MRAALIQLTVSDDPAANLAATLALVDRAVAGGAGFVLTPEMTNCLSSSRDHQRAVFRPEEADETLAALRQAAARAGVWLLIGSLGLVDAGCRRALCQPQFPDRARWRHRRAL
jgi:predicted amidohydrolase